MSNDVFDFDPDAPIVSAPARGHTRPRRPARPVCCPRCGFEVATGEAPGPAAAKLLAVLLAAALAGLLALAAVPAS